MFTGKFKRRTSTRAYTGPRASHAMESDDFFVVPRGLIEDASVVDLSHDMIAAANEALEGEVANATFIRFYSVADVNNDTRKADKADAVALYAARDLYETEEIFTHYGSAYPRTWVPGRPAQLKKMDVRPPRDCLPSVPPDAYALV